VGKIIETIYHDNVSSITSFGPAVLNNSFYMLNDKKPVICTYYNIDKLKSTLDPGSKLAYDNIGNQTPLRFNRVNNFLLYGIDRIELTTDIEEYGLEADKITGDAYILPNTIVPIEGDYFEIEHITDSSWLFIVTDVQTDTMKDGSNVYKIQYRLEYVDHDRLMQDVADDFELIESRDGTNIVHVIESTKLAKAKRLDQVAVMLKKYFNDLFYNNKVQTFTYMDLTEWRIYDQFMIEFLIRNKILDNGYDDYVHVCHQLMLPDTFTIDYDNTFFRAFEKKDKKLLSKSNRAAYPEDIISYGTTFAARFETYFKLKYEYRQSLDSGQPFPDELMYQILDNKLINDQCPEANKDKWKNILIKYFNGGSIDESELEAVENMPFERSVDAFYMIPLLIFCIEEAIKTLIKWTLK